VRSSEACETGVTKGIGQTITRAASALVILLAFATAGCGRKPMPQPHAPITFASCLQSLTNINALADAPFGKTAMVSSHDRTGGNSDWMAPRELGPGDTLELANLEGPGCLTRIWFTSLGGQEWMFYFDGEDTPRIHCTGRELLGDKAPFFSPLAGRSSGGAYSYVPIPYAKSLRVVIKTKPFTRSSRKYFHINYRTFPKGANVTSFPRELDEETVALVREVCRAWQSCGSVGSDDELAGEGAMAGRWTLNGGESATCFDLEGAGVLREWRLRLAPGQNVGAVARAGLLRDLVLRMYWDGSPLPSVEVPVGDFFCNAFHRREFAALPLVHTNGAYTCRFPMPFRENARGVIANEGTTPVTVEWTGQRSTNTPAADARYFHAAWSAAVGSGTPFTVLNARGEGHLVGCYLNVISTQGDWRILEGDEVIRVDGETQPSWHGTGLEDYFSGAWYYTGLSDLPTHGLLEKAAMRTGQYRFHSLDAVPFDKSLGMTFEFGEANRSQGYMSSVAYWYQAKPCASGTVLPTAERRRPPADPFEAPALMGGLFELERIGHIEEAAERCAYYADKYANTPMGQVMKLRELACRERCHGVDTVLDSYRQIAAQTNFPAVSQQARALLFPHEAAGNALLATHVNAKFKLYLDGALAAEGDDPANLRIRAARLSPGRHEMAVEVKSVRPDAWFSMCLRWNGGEVRSDQKWERARTRPASWPKTGDSGKGWEPVAPFDAADMLPRMGFWKFSPNAFVETQGEIQLIRPWKSWPGVDPASTVYLRRVFTVPEQ